MLECTVDEASTTGPIFHPESIAMRSDARILLCPRYAGNKVCGPVKVSADAFW